MAPRRARNFTRCGAALLLATALPAQARRPCLGAVVDADGAPVADARVQAVYASPGDPSFLHDEQAATTDARGRFRLDLWNGVGYAHWVIGPVRHDGGRLVSRLHHGATGGGLLALRADVVQRPRSLKIAGLGAWREHGASALVVHCSGLDFGGRPVTLPEDGRGPVALPPLPASPLGLFVLDAAGQPLVGAVLSEEAAPAVALKAPVEHRVRRDRAIGSEPETGALQLLLQVPDSDPNGSVYSPAPRYRAREVASAKEQVGEARRVVVGDRHVDERPLAFWAGGVVARVVDGELHAQAHVAPVEPQGDGMRAERALDGSLLLAASPERTSAVEFDRAVGPDEPALVLRRRGDGTPWYVREIAERRTGAQLLAGLRLEAAWPRADVYAVARAPAEGAARRLPPLVRVGAAWREAAPDGASGAPPVLVTVTVRGVDGGPARAAWVDVRPIEPDAPAVSAEPWRPVDSGGRVAWRLPPGDYGVYALDARGHSFRRWQLGADGPRALTIDLVRTPTMTCLVQDRNGAPAEGARLSTFAYGGRAGRVTGFEAQVRDVAVQAMYRTSRGAVSDSRGLVTLPVYPELPRDCSVWFRRVDGSETRRVTMRPNDAPSVIR